MAKAAIVHLEKVIQYFINGIETSPSPADKLRNAIFPTMETIETEFQTELKIVSYKNQKELESKFWQTADEYKNFINPRDLIIQKL